MKKMKIEICVGTACFVMGSMKLMNIKDKLPEKIAEQIELKASLCCELCRNWKDSKPPIALINDELITMASEDKLLGAIYAESE